jgi:hypothetical protein
MKIYADRIEIADFKETDFKPGELRRRLYGINIHRNQQSLFVEPVYLPLLKIERRGGLAFIEISIKKLRYLVVLYPRFPYVHFEPLSGIELEGDP